MSKEDIDKAVKEAEQYAAEDKKRREEVDIRNDADQMVYQTEKALGELGDKVPAEPEKADVQHQAGCAEGSAEGPATSTPSSPSRKICRSQFEEIYKAGCRCQCPDMGAQAGARVRRPQGGTKGDDGVVDADFKEV